jgi:catechol 1,2-dioxygenase
MSVKLSETSQREQFLRIVSGFGQSAGDARTKQIVHRIVTDLYKTIDDFDIRPDEFWFAVTYLNDLGASGEAGLLAAGLGLEHFLDLKLDAEDKETIRAARLDRVDQVRS